MIKASRAQLELMAALGVFRSQDMTEAEATELIDEAKSRGVEPDWNKKDVAAAQISRILKQRAAAALKMKRRTAQSLKAAKAQDYRPEIIHNLEQDLALWNREIEQLKTGGKDDRKDYLEFWQERMGDDTDCGQLGYSAHLRKPSPEQIDRVLRKLDKQIPGWDGPAAAGHFVHEEEYVFQALIRKYPKLRQEDGACSHLSDVYENARAINLLQPETSTPQQEAERARPLTRVLTTAPLVLVSCLAIIVVYAIIDKGDEWSVADETPPAPSQPGESSAKQSAAPPAKSAISLENFLWMNADETDDMRVRFTLTNTGDSPVSGIALELKFYEVEGNKIEGSKIISLSDVIRPGESKRYHDFSLGDYPQETVRVKAEVVSPANKAKRN